MKDLTFGVELELINIDRAQAVRAIQTVIGGTIQTSPYSGNVCIAPDGRKWMAVTDGSINGRGCEVVTPILRYADLENLQSVIRALRAAGASVNTSCGVHVHVGASHLNEKQVANLAKLTYKHEDFLYLGIDESRKHGQWCKPVAEAFAAKLKKAPASMRTLRRDWYAGNGSHDDGTKYNNSRYRALNLHSLFFRGTVEFRWFAGTTHAGKVKSYVQLCLAMVHKAETAKSVSLKKRTVRPDIARRCFFQFLTGVLGLTGDEFKTARHHLSRAYQGMEPAAARRIAA